MSRSIHTTRKDFRGLTKKQLEEQVLDPDSDMASWAKKSGIKRAARKKRKVKKFVKKNSN